MNVASENSVGILVSVFLGLCLLWFLAWMECFWRTSLFPAHFDVPHLLVVVGCDSLT